MAEGTHLDQIVAVTGSTGYIGSHVVRVLLERGYTVRATVRDAKNEEKNAFLKALPGPGKLELWSADLEKEGSFDEAFQGADFVIHTAAVVKLTADDPQREIVDVAVNGVKNVLASCEKARKEGPRLKRFIMTSSIAAIHDLHLPDGHIYTEADNNLGATVQTEPYPLAKYLSEKLAVEIIKALPEDLRFSYGFINPGAVYGPLLVSHHVTSSPQIIENLMTGKFPGAPQLAFPAVDVRDVAEAHVVLMEKAEFEGRYVCVENTYTLWQLNEFGKQAYPQGTKFARFQLPNFLMYAACLFDKRVTFRFLRDNLGKFPIFSNEKIKKDLGINFRFMPTTVKDTCQSLIDLKLVQSS